MKCALSYNKHFESNDERLHFLLNAIYSDFKRYCDKFIREYGAFYILPTIARYEAVIIQ